MSNTIQPCMAGQPAGYCCTRENGHPGKCASVCVQPAELPSTARQLALHLTDAIFEGFGSNWRWATIDYRGVARVHTFEPQLTDTGRIAVPRFKGNSSTCEAFDIVDKLPTNWFPVLFKRDMRAAGVKIAPTDRFGMQLPDGADPVEAADVKVDKHPLLGVVDVKVESTSKYTVRRTEQCRCEISEKQLKEILARELGVAIDSTASFNLYQHEGGVTVEWVRAL